MQVKNFFNLLFFVLVFTYCKDKKAEQQEKVEGEAMSFTIKGKITNAPVDNVVLKKMSNTGWTSVDTVKMDKSGNFKFKGSTPEADFYRISVSDSLTFIVIVDEEEIIVNGDFIQGPKSLVITGSSGTTQFYAFANKMQSWDSTEISLQKQITSTNGDEGLQRKLKIHQLKKSLFIKTYIDSIKPTLAVFYMKDFLNPEEEIEYLTALSNKIDTVLAKSKYTKAFSSDLQQIKDALVQKEQSTRNSSVAIGMPAPEIALPDPNGKVIPLSSLKGKYVLIDFWASWCGPCRAENPNVKRVYDNYKDKGLEIYGVSLDADKAAWTNAIAKDQLPWLHVSDLKYWNSSVVSQYGLEGIPATFLLDRKGVIIARNLRGEELSSKLQEILK